jgi:hypothetical protein
MPGFSRTLTVPATLTALALAPAAQAQTAAELAFRDSVDAPPAGYSGPVFELSHDFPVENPGTCSESDCPWLYIDVDFTSGEPVDWNSGPWNDYFMAIWEVVTRGQDPNLPNEVGVRTEVDGETAWYHVPWMAYDPTAGREFAHGTTNERTAHLSDFIGSPMPNAVPLSAMGRSARRSSRMGSKAGRWACTTPGAATRSGRPSPATARPR